jgi:hypothetical protein
MSPLVEDHGSQHYSAPPPLESAWTLRLRSRGEVVAPSLTALAGSTDRSTSRWKQTIEQKEEEALPKMTQPTNTPNQ